MKKRKKTPSPFHELAAQVVLDVIHGRWESLMDKPWAEVRCFLQEELLQRCPGYSTRDYRTAISRALAVGAHARALRRLAFEAKRG